MKMFNIFKGGNYVLIFVQVMKYAYKMHCEEIDLRYVISPTMKALLDETPISKLLTVVPIAHFCKFILLLHGTLHSFAVKLLSLG